MKTKLKFVALAVLIVGALAWLATGGINETKTYYKTISELGQMGGPGRYGKAAARGRRCRDRARSSARAREVEFVLMQDNRA